LEQPESLESRHSGSTRLLKPGKKQRSLRLPKGWPDLLVAQGQKSSLLLAKHTRLRLLKREKLHDLLAKKRLPRFRLLAAQT
jgi:hypothetical protein